MDLGQTEKNINYSFKNKNLLKQALTHSSYIENYVKPANYQRLEFLGDSVLGFVISDYLFKKFPSYSDGNLSILKHELVKTESLYEIGQHFNLSEFIIFGNGDISVIGKTNKTIIEDVVEAIIGAIYLDSDFEFIKNWIVNVYEKYFSEKINNDIEQSRGFTTKLQLYCQSKYKTPPTYTLISKRGEEHNPTFKMKVSILHYEETASGKSKKEAIEIASKKLLEQLKEKK